MSRFRGQTYFATGPHTFHVHGLSLRHQLVDQPDVDGTRIIALGRTARSIHQYGTLSAGGVIELQEQIDAIEAAIDGVAGELVDDLGRVWPRMVLLELTLDPIRRRGIVLSVRYEARYVQVNTGLLPLGELLNGGV